MLMPLMLYIIVYTQVDMRCLQYLLKIDLMGVTKADDNLLI